LRIAINVVQPPGRGFLNAYLRLGHHGNQARLRAMTAAAVKGLYDDSGAAQAWVSSALSRSNAAASLVSLSRRIRSRTYSLTFSYSPCSPTFVATNSLRGPLRRTVMVVVFGLGMVRSLQS